MVSLATPISLTLPFSIHVRATAAHATAATPSPSPPLLYRLFGGALRHATIDSVRPSSHCATEQRYGAHTHGLGRPSPCAPARYGATALALGRGKGIVPPHTAKVAM